MNRLFFLFLTCILPGIFFSQIICTDVNPDVNNSGIASLDIDLNNDATPDFRITSAQISTLSFVVAQAGQIGTGNFILSNTSGEALALPIGTPIGSNSTIWTQMNGANQFMTLIAGSTVQGTWAGATDHYLGLKLIVGTNTYYGWARFSFSASSNAYIFKDYAYNSAPDQQIFAGQGCGSIQYPAFVLPAAACVNSMIPLIANTGTQTAFTYNWLTFPTGGVVSAASSASSSVTFTAGGTYTVLLVVSAGTLIGVIQNTIDVGFTPTLTSNSPVCAGNTLTFSAAGGTLYSWTGPASYTSASQTNSLLNVSQSGVYSVQVTNAIGCTAGATATLQVNALPVLSLSPQSATICAGKNASLTAAGAFQYTWSPGNSLSSTSGSMVLASPAASQVYTVTGIQHGCISTETIDIEVRLPLSATLLFANSYTFCAQPFANSPSTSSIAVSTATMSDLAGYTLTAPGTTLLVSQLNNLALQISAPPPYASGSNTLLLSLSDNVCEIFIPVTVSVVANPTINVTSSATQVCEASLISFTATGASAYTWSVTGTNTQTFSGSVLNTVATPNQTYMLTGTDYDCASVPFVAQLTVLPAPALTVNTITLCVTESGTISAAGAVSYTWKGPSGFTSTQASPVITAGKTTGIYIYTVTGTGANSCAATQTLAVDAQICDGLMTHSEARFDVFPVPGIGQVTITAPAAAELLVLDVSGRIVYVIRIRQTETTVDLSHLGAGCFTLQDKNSGLNKRIVLLNP